MRILHICWGTETWNGAANIARLIMGEQRAAGHDVTLVSRPSRAQLCAADEVWCHCGWYWMFWLLALVRTLHLVPRTRLYWMPECCYDPVRIAYHGWKKRLVGPFERAALRRADVLVATCGAEAAWIRAYLGIRKEESGTRGPRIEVTDIKRFFNLGKKVGVESRWRKAGEPLHVLYLGRPHPLKGTRYLERAVEELNHHCPPTFSTYSLVTLREVSGKPKEALEPDWQWADVLCLPTLSDNFGLVIAEALARGKPVITTDGAPAWDPEEVERVGGGGEWTKSLIYLRGYREGTDEDRVKLLKDALEGMLNSSSVVKS